MEIVIYESSAVPASVRRALATDGHRIHVVEREADVVPCDLIVLDADRWRDLGTELARKLPNTALLCLVSDLEIALPTDARALLKPLDPNKLVRMVREVDGARTGAFDPRELVDFETLFSGESPAIVELLRQVKLLGQSDAPVWLHGELGTGRAVVARAIHDHSTRRPRMFMAVNAASLPGDLLEEHLFGGAEPAVRRANAGTLFIDNVTELAPGVQAKLLRLLEERRLRVRATDDELDVRMMVGDERRTLNVGGRLRRELFYRLRVHELDLPPLRERARDVGSIITRLLARLQRDGGSSTLSIAAMRTLASYPFPGNVRELADALTHAIILAQGRSIEIEHLPLDIQSRVVEDPADPVEALEALDEVARRFERDYLLRVLRAVGGNRTRAARILKLSRKGLWQKLKAHGIASSEGRTEADDAE